MDISLFDGEDELIISNSNLNNSNFVELTICRTTILVPIDELYSAVLALKEAKRLFLEQDKLLS